MGSIDRLTTPGFEASSRRQKWRTRHLDRGLDHPHRRVLKSLTQRILATGALVAGATKSLFWRGT
jgi:hypothetical protein